MITKTITGRNKTSKAIKFALEKIKYGDVLFTCMNQNEVVRVIHILSNELLNKEIDQKFDFINKVITIYGNKLYIKTRKHYHRIIAYRFYCAIVDDYDINLHDDILFLNHLKCRLRQRVSLPYYKNDYFINELLITIHYRR